MGESEEIGKVLQENFPGTQFVIYLLEKSGGKNIVVVWNGNGKGPSFTDVNGLLKKFPGVLPNRSAELIITKCEEGKENAVQTCLQ